MKHPRIRIQAAICWLLAGEVIALVVTGLYLHRPAAGASYGQATFLHLIAGYGLLATAGFGVYWSILGQPRDQRRLHRDGGTEPAALLGRGWTMAVLWAVIAALAATGLVLRFPGQDVFAAVAHGLGGVIGTRIVHYLLTWALLAASSVHVYARVRGDHGVPRTRRHLRSPKRKRTKAVDMPPDRKRAASRSSETKASDE